MFGERGSVWVDRPVLLARRRPVGASLRGHVARVRGVEHGDREPWIRPRVVFVLHKPAGDVWRGIEQGRKPRIVKPSSEGPEGPRAKSIGSSDGVERRWSESTSSEVLSVEASLFVTRRHPHGEALETGLAEAEEGSRKGHPDEAEATGRQRFGHRSRFGSEEARRSEVVRRSGAFRRERNARPMSDGISVPE